MALKRITVEGAMIGALLLGLQGSARSEDAPPQYMYDPSNADEQQGIKYFGAAKDANGVLLKDVTFQFVTPAATFVFVTNDQGRYRGNLPDGMTPAKIKSICFKAGYEMTRLDVRPGPTAPRPTVEIDCFLRAANVS